MHRRGWSGQVSLAVVIIALAGGSTRLVARDLQSLVEFVAPAYTAMNFASVCAQDHPEFFVQTAGPRGTAIHYAEHVKDEAIEGLTHDEAVSVLTAAADHARTRATETLMRLRGDLGPLLGSERLRQWCGSEGAQLVRNFIEHHDRDHVLLVERLRQARQ